MIVLLESIDHYLYMWHTNFTGDGVLHGIIDLGLVVAIILMKPLSNLISVYIIKLRMVNQRVANVCS